MRRLMCILLTLLLIMVAVLFTGSALASGYATYDTYEDWSYLWDGDEATLLKYKGNGTSVSVPSIIKGKKVVAVYPTYLNSNIKHITIYADITTFDSSWLGGAHHVETVNLGSKVETIAAGTFKDDYPSLQRIIMPGVKKIGDKAFYGCSRLSVIDSADNVEEIGDSAFEGCNWLKSINIGASIKTVGANAFANCSQLETVEFEAAPETIGSKAFYNCPKLTKVAIGDGPCTIDAYAFQECRELTDVRLPEGLTKIGEFAFSQCTKLSSLRIPSTLVGIGWYSLPSAYITEIILADGLQAIGYEWFKGFKNLTSIDIPDSVKSIGSNAFEKCTALETVHFGKNLESIGHYAFSECSALKTVLLPDSVISIGYNAFYNCSSITEAILGKNITEIGDDAFFYCSSLSYIDMGEHLYSLGGSALHGCTALTSVRLPSTLRVIGKEKYNPFSWSGIKSISIPEGVTSICGGFYQEKIYLPRSLTEIIGKFKYSDSATPIIYCYEGSFADKYAQENQIDLCYLDDFRFSRSGSLTVDSMMLTLGESAPVRYQVFPDTGEDVTYSTTNSRVAYVSSDGVVHAVGRGFAYIGVKYGDYTSHARVRVVVPITELSLEDIVAALNENVQVHPYYTPANADVEFHYSGGNKWVTIDDDGNFLGTWQYSLTITVTDAISGLSATCRASVTDLVSSITLEAEEIKMLARETAQITAHVEAGQYYKYDNKLVKFQSSDTSVATVDANGLVTAKNGGTATITVSASSGVTATCTVIVENPVELHIPRGVQRIEAEAFVAGGFNAVYIPDGCIYIESRAFAANPGLLKVYLPAEMEHIANDAFALCYQVTMVVPEGSWSANWAKRHGFPVEYDTSR